MNVQSLSFLLFLAVTVLLCRLNADKHPMAARRLLEIACVVFYLAGDHGKASLLVLLAGIAVSMAAARYLTSGKTEQGRKTVAMLAALWHIGVLMVFKYTGFFTGGALTIGWAPLGLSFFTFQQLWLLKALYEGSYRPNTTEDFLLFGLFFPVLTSGPILRPDDFFPQLTGGKFLRPDGQDMVAGLYAFALGLAKKTLLADSFGTLVANGRALGETMTAPAAWVVIFGYTLQLYFDFSGYCDLVTGAARMLGVRLPVNFNSPYHALSVGEFWKRWHITLTSFLRECVYIPLGGSRKGAGRTYLHILIVFLISGFWHGAGWTFIVWGALHGLAQVVERMWGSGRDRLPKVLRWAGTFLFVSLAWVFFQSPDLTSAAELLKAAFAGGAGLPLDALLTGVFESEVTAVETLLPVAAKFLPQMTLAGLFGAGTVVILWPRNTVSRMDEFQPNGWNLVVCAVLMLWSVLSFSGVATFIYSNF